MWEAVIVVSAMWDLLNRVRLPEWEVRILGERPHHTSATGISAPTHGLIEEANQSDVVLFVSGQGARTKMKDSDWLSRFRLDPVGSVIDHTTENPCVGGSIPSLATKRFKSLRPPSRWPSPFHLYIRPQGCEECGKELPLRD